MVANVDTDATSKSTPSWPDILRDLKVLREDLAKLAGSALEAGEDKVAAEARSLTAMATKVIGQVEDEGRSLVDTVESCVTQKPVASVALSFAAGLILASLFSRRR